MNILFLYHSLRLSGGTWNRSSKLCSVLERHHRLRYAYQVVEQSSWDATRNEALKAELLGAAQFENAGFDCLMIDGHTHEDPDFPRVPVEVLRAFTQTGGTVIFLFEDRQRIVAHQLTVEQVNELTGATGLIHTLFVHPSGSIVHGTRPSSGPVSIATDQRYLARFEPHVVSCYQSVHRLLVNDPLYLDPVFDELCCGDRDLLWITQEDLPVETMRAAPPAFASLLRREGLSMFLTGDLWRDYLSAQAPDNLVFIDNLLRYAEQYQRDQGRRPPRPAVFISYSHANREVAVAIAGGLERVGAEVWLDEKMMAYGASISESCEAGIRRSDKALFVLTPESVASDWVRHELATALAVAGERQRSRFIIPLVVKVGHKELEAALPEVRNIKYFVLDDDALASSPEVAERILR